MAARCYFHKVRAFLERCAYVSSYSLALHSGYTLPGRHLRYFRLKSSSKMSLVRGFTRLTGGLRSQGHIVRICQPCRKYAEDAKASAPTQMSFSFGYPGKMFYTNASVKQVDVPSGTGSFGILAQHVPSLAVLKPGTISVTEDDGSISKYFVSSGMVTVNDDSSVQILAEMAAAVEDLDPQAIKEGMTKAQQELAAAATDLARAEAQIAVEVHEAMDAAVNK